MGQITNNNNNTSNNLILLMFDSVSFDQELILMAYLKTEVYDVLSES